MLLDNLSLLVDPQSAMGGNSQISTSLGGVYRTKWLKFLILDLTNPNS